MLPKISVITITYNHEKYIIDTIKGVLEQKYPGEIEFIISNDCSTDKTHEVVTNFLNQNRIPENIKVKYFFHKKNKGMMANFTWSIQQGTGIYISLCEGDDYWIDPLKLQKQVEILERNPNIEICSHASFIKVGKDQNNKLIGYWGEEQRIFSFEEVIWNFASTAPLHSILFRNKKIEQFKDICAVSLGGHSMTQIFYSYPNGLIYLPEKMSVYRADSESSISKILFKNDKEYLKRQLKNFDGLNVLSKYIDDKDLHIIEKAKRKQAIGWISTNQTTAGQNLFLIIKYKLYKDRENLINCLLRIYKIKIKRFLKSFKKS